MSIAYRESEDEVEVEVVVVASGCTDDTVAWLEAYSGALPLRVIVEPQPGVARARNRGLDVIDGDAVLFLDDDVSVQSDILQVYGAAFAAHPDCGCFAGAILARLEGHPPDMIRDVARVLPSTFSELWLGDEPRAMDPAEEAPYSANMAIRMQALAGLRFLESLGRKGHGNLEAGEETLLFAQMSRAGVRTMWLPQARVTHWIHPGRQSMKYVREYWYQIGVMQSALGHDIPRFLQRRTGGRFAFFYAYLYNRLTKPPDVWLPAMADMMIRRGHEDRLSRKVR